uniref:Hsp90 chaperone protein kinase-targeting subunit n=1 Tax=Alexandrium catenella TaxID=2925 RepID=A0A7S1QM02_ALECA
MPSGFDYSKWDNIELSDDEEDVHPNIDKDSWFRLKHRTRVEKEEDEAKTRKSHEARLKELRTDLARYGEAGKEHMKAKKLQQEIDKIEGELAEIDKHRKWNADNMCKTDESRTVVTESLAPTPQPEPRLKGEAIAEGYCEFVEANEALLEEYISMGEEDDLEKVGDYLRRHGGTLLQGEHAESYLLLDCLEKEMNGEHSAMTGSARQYQLLCQLREFSRASGRPARDAVNPVFQRLLDHEPTKDSFEETVANFVVRIEKRAVVKKKEMDAEREEEEGVPGPGGLNPTEVFHSLPPEMREAFEAKDTQRLQAAIEALPEEEARYHLKRCEDSGLWVPNPDAGPPPYRD